MSNGTVFVARERLRRLGTLTDCVYAVSLVLVLQWLPLPSESTESGGHVFLLGLFAEFAGNIMAIVIAVVFIIMYWLRSTDLGARMDRTSGMHVTLSILSVCSLLLLLYVVRVGAEVEGAAARAGESIGVALIGIFSGAAFWYARRKRLVREGISEEELRGLQIESFTEPISALITLPVAFFSELWWNLSWFIWLPAAKLLSRRLSR